MEAKNNEKGFLFPQQTFKNCPSKLLSNCFSVLTNSVPLTYHTGLLQFLSASYNHIGGQFTWRLQVELMNRRMARTSQGTRREQKTMSGKKKKKILILYC